ncbi:MAG: SRPBCC family protein [Polyangiaceae bacterium]
MAESVFVLRSVFKCTPEELFAFHERPEALPLLSPRDGSIRVVKPPASLHVGEEAIVKVGFGPLRATWIARHTAYDPPRRFVDEQVSGPFKSWRHEHRVEPCPEGAALTDEIHFELPAGPLGRLVAPIVMRTLRKSFEERHATTRREVERPPVR